MVLSTNTKNRITLSIDAPIMARLNDYHAKTEIPKTRIINKALKNYLDELEEDWQDARTGETAWAEYIASGRESTSSADTRKELGL